MVRPPFRRSARSSVLPKLRELRPTIGGSLLVVMAGLATLALVGGCVDDSSPSRDACTTDAECDDGAFCDGAESCVAGVCAKGSQVTCEDGQACTFDLCDEQHDSCRSLPDHSLCPSGELCGAGAGCHAAPECAFDTDCDDGVHCDGVETCNAGTCVMGSRPNCIDENLSTVDLCDEASTRCVHVAVPAGTIHCEGSVCACPERDENTTDRHVDAAVDRSLYPGIVTNGIEFPAACRHETITSALDAASTGPQATLLLHGTSDETAYDNEVFPLAIPSGITVRPASYDEGELVIHFDGSADHAIELAGTLVGVSVDGTTSNSGSGIVTTGVAVLDSTVIRGFANDGLVVHGNLVAARLDVDSNGGHGVVIAEGTVSLGLGGGAMDSTIHRNGGDGIVIGSTNASGQLGSIVARVASTSIELNAGRGVVVGQPEGQDVIQTSITMLSNIIRENGLAGLVLNTAHLVDDSLEGAPFRRNMVVGNAMLAATCTAEQVEPQIFVMGPVAGDPSTCAGIGSESGCVAASALDCLWVDAVCRLAWNLSGADACAAPNRIAGFNPFVGTPSAVGLRAEGGAVVDLRSNAWFIAPSYSSELGSAVAASTTCASIPCGF